MLFASLRVLGGTLFFLAMAATVGIPAGRRGPVAAEPNSGEPLLGLDLYRPAPEDNPPTPEKVALGRRLFHERLLSRDGSLSCAGCHDPARAFTNGKPVATGSYGRAGRRNVPALFNRAWGRTFFWDGRAPSLEAQAVQPITSASEMDMGIEEVVERLGRQPDYALAFRDAFGGKIRAEDLARALASYVRAILSGDSPYDRHLAGRANALSPDAQEGLRIFRGRATASLATPVPSSPTKSSTTPASPGATGDGSMPAGSRSPASRRTSAGSRLQACARSPAPRPTCTTAASRAWKK